MLTQVVLTLAGWVPPGWSVVVTLVKGPGTVLKDWVWGWWCWKEDLAALDWSVPASDPLSPELVSNQKLPVSVHLSWEWDSSFDQ